MIITLGELKPNDCFLLFMVAFAACCYTRRGKELPYISDGGVPVHRLRP